jgi:hypothetical protein
MKLYKLTFNSCTNSMKNTIGCGGKCEPHFLAVQDGVLYVAVPKISDLQHFDIYGKGIKTAEMLGGVFVFEDGAHTMPDPIEEKEETA